MEDSFFGFDTSVPLDDDGGGQIAEPSEEEYDALNDETFGSAINGDWEEAHESLVRLTGNRAVRTGGDVLRGDGKNTYTASTSGGSTPALFNSRLGRGDRIADSDLELNLSGMKLDDVDLHFDDTGSVGGGTGGAINMDPSVWSSPHNFLEGGKSRGMLFGNANNNSGTNPVDFLREHFPSPFQQEHHLQHQSGANSAFNLPQFSQSPNSPKFCTLEDIERNIIVQQTMQKQQQQQQHQHQHHQQQHQQQSRLQQDQQQLHLQQQQQLFNDILKQSPKTPTPMQQQQHSQTQQAQQKGPPGFPQSPPRPSNNFANNLAQHPLTNIMQQQQQSNAGGNRLPPGFPLYPPGLAAHLQHGPHPQLPPHPLLNQHGIPPNFVHPHQRPLPNPHLPIALNNFAMHPNFNAMRAAAAAAGIHSAALVPPAQQMTRHIPPHPPNSAAVINHHHSNSMYNIFNMRLVQEIQQNHPLLQNAARQGQQQQHVVGHTHLHHQLQRGVGAVKPNHHRRDGGTGNGNLPHEEFDEYANLMSTRDKHWLIGIQLSQLNTDTPYIDDYYYTVYRERKAELSGNMRHSQAHKDNQLNHPLTQPKGHAQLILVQLGNKNGTRNGQHRERRSSETGGGGANNSNGQDQKTPYVFTPLKFENSLGKLQYGSVTAPRKIIDADIMSGDSVETNNPKSTAGTPTLSKSAASTTALLSALVGTAIGDMTSSAQRKSRHILLHIETLYRIALKLEDLDNPNAIATIIMKKKKESERIAALEQLENANKTAEERASEASNPQTMNPALKNKFAYEIETKEALIAKLIAGLTHDKIVAMMNVRKGKALIRRIMPYIDEQDIRWNIWIGVFSSLQNVVKKDRDDADGVLYALYPEFKKQIKQADFESIVRISASIALNDKKSNGVFCSRFGISSLVCLILQAEQIYVADSDATLNDVNRESWRQFLDHVATSLNRTIQNQTICAAIESDSIQPMMNHFARFKDLKLDSLLALITEAKQQIN